MRVRTLNMKCDVAHFVSLTNSFMRGPLFDLHVVVPITQFAHVLFAFSFISFSASKRAT